MPTTISSEPTIAYFCMEIGLDAGMPTYSGGLGVLAGDTLRGAADLGVPIVGVTLLHHKGYFRQYLDSRGDQSEGPATWAPRDHLVPLPWRVEVHLEDRRVQVAMWRYLVQGVSGHIVPVYFLDTGLPENSPWDQGLTDQLYGGDERYRLCQEVILGVGGVLALRAMGYERIRVHHLNEGHTALVTLALLEEQAAGRPLSQLTASDWEAVRSRCVFTTHTPVNAGHDSFATDLVRQVLGHQRAAALTLASNARDGELNLTQLCLALSRGSNAVSFRHGQVSSAIFGQRCTNSITNGVHAVTWTSPPFRHLYDRHIPMWRSDNLYLRHGTTIPLEEVRKAHQDAKGVLLAEVQRRTGHHLDPNAMTIGFARRATGYKRADLLFYDLERLKRIAGSAGPLQVIFGGKAHPRDEGGKGMIRRVFEAASALQGLIPVVYLEEYDLELGRRLCSGVDLWLNTPQKPYEASGTSGMKAALNGVPMLSVLDGWWLEGHHEGITGWSIGDSPEPQGPDEDASSLYDKLEHTILPMFYEAPDQFAQVMRSAIALNGPYFNTHRMVSQYLYHLYFTADSLLWEFDSQEARWHQHPVNPDPDSREDGERNALVTSR